MHINFLMQHFFKSVVCSLTCKIPTSAINYSIAINVLSLKRYASHHKSYRTVITHLLKQFKIPYERHEEVTKTFFEGISEKSLKVEKNKNYFFTEDDKTSELFVMNHHCLQQCYHSMYYSLHCFTCQPTLIQRQPFAEK